MIPFISEFKAKMKQLGDPNRAAQMQAYLKTTQPLYGVNAKNRRDFVKDLLKIHPFSESELRDLCFTLWNGLYREEMHAALDIIEKQKRILLTQSNFDYFKSYFDRADNWDLLDPLASNILGIIFLKNRHVKYDIYTWTSHENMWVRRAAILVHLKHKKQTDLDMLGATIEKLVHEPDFFIRKAIGWALRTAGEFNPKWVILFVENHPELSNLSKREALRKLELKSS